MHRNPHVTARIDLPRIRANALDIRRRVGVSLLAVVKADAYGVGADAVAKAIGDVVDGFCVFTLDEAIAADLWRVTGKPSIALGPPEVLDPGPYLEHHVRPVVSTIEQAAALRAARPIISVDTGMQRFSCPPELLDAVIRAGGCEEAITHAVSIGNVERLAALLQGRGMKLHAAASAMLDDPAARLDAVRPGLALYREAVRVTMRLVEVHDSRGPAGYTGFVLPHHGIVRCGYASGLRPGICIINGTRRRIVEVGMQTAFVEIAATDRVGDEVVLLGDGLTEVEAAQAWRCTPQEVLLRLCACGVREYV